MGAVVPAADAIAVFSALLTYERQIVPLVRGELERWQARAATIPDPILRAAALSALREKGQNAEATAVFAILAPRANRVGALRAMAALQVAIDYLDSLGEQPVDDPLADGLALHSALCDAVSPDARPGDWYSLHPQREDGGYLAALVAECQERVAGLPATEAVLPLLQRAAKRCGEGQSHTHAAGAAGGDEIEAWAIRQESAAGISLVGAGGGRQLLGGGPRADRRGRRPEDDRGGGGADRRRLLPPDRRADRAARRPDRPRRGPRSRPAQLPELLRERGGGGEPDRPAREPGQSRDAASAPRPAAPRDSRRRRGLLPECAGRRAADTLARSGSACSNHSTPPCA